MLTRHQVPSLAEENREFAGTGGVSENNAQANFAPAFQDAGTGEVEISRFKNGQPAPFHLLDGLPDKWILERDVKGRVVTVKASIVSGFVRLGEFFTRQEAAEFMAHVETNVL
ncbi:hypothetical protein QKW35_19630 [Pontibacterium granulatum]|uniref:hypothetical protein n=1 Tax=Pontibacterium granulatum TaxID=2036029 RepID=UPI00249C30D3|nr:hypothetical protein [Pontibacterium granulatum]MDI3326595.1 hypothetical protein [Pontibacterium granulatum]